MQAALQAGARVKPYQIVVWGASGFTGRLVCEHLAKNYSGQVKWAMAGRDKAKLERIRTDLTSINDNCRDVPILVADATNAKTLQELANQAQVVLSTVGPYNKHNGGNVVEACIEGGAHYCDLTGEVSFIKRMQLKYDAMAKQRGVKIVHCCGFDSIPSDLGVLYLADYCRTKLGKGCAEVHGCVADLKGAVSGGTSETIFWVVNNESLSELQAMGSDKYYLVRDSSKVGRDSQLGPWPQWDTLLASWTGPWFMETVNTRVVHLSNALRSTPYGTNFRYQERLAQQSWLQAGLLSVGTALATVLIAVPPLRPLLRRLLPQPGGGPTREQMLSGSWALKFAGLTEEPDGQKPTTVRATVKDPHGDPGYWSTSRMLLESGLALALQQAELQAAGLQQGGILTPASAMGMVLVRRLQAAGIKFEASHS